MGVLSDRRAQWRGGLIYNIEQGLIERGVIWDGTLRGRRCNREGEFLDRELNIEQGLIERRVIWDGTLRGRRCNREGLNGEGEFLDRELNIEQG